MDQLLERDLLEARLRNVVRLAAKRPAKKLPRWRVEASEAQLLRVAGKLRRENKRLAKAAKAISLNQKQYRHCTGSRKNLKQYGLTTDSWLQLLDKQQSQCAICGKEEHYGSALAIDHCHTTNRVRGLLCRSCNVALGLFKDDIELMAKAIAYLRHA